MCLFSLRVPALHGGHWASQVGEGLQELGSEASSRRWGQTDRLEHASGFQIGIYFKF